MSPDEFEKHLQRQPLRKVPDEWRAEILRSAKSVQPSPVAPLARRSEAKEARPSLLSTINHHLSTLLWPHPKAWAGLAAVWTALILVHFASGDSTGNVEKKAEVPSPQTLIALKQQQELLAELVGQPPSHEVDRPKRIFQPPRSERRREELLA